jgi:transcriptional regulator with XRE-family HTH domain
MYEKYCKLRDSKGVKDADVARETGIPKSTFSDWKKSRSAPKSEKLQKIADYFNVSISYFAGEKSESFQNVPEELQQIVDKSKLLNNNGISELVRYLDYLLTRSEFKKDEKLAM